MSVWIYVAVAVTLGPVARRGRAQQRPEKSPGQFVQQFYDWYVPCLRAEGIGSNHVLRTGRALFSSALYRALVEDSLVGAQADDETIVLDFNPFVNSQELCERYVIGATVRKGTSYAVAVNEICSGHAGRQPALIAEVRLIAGRWVFIDFDYGGGSGLRALLRRQHEERARVARP